MTKPIFRPLSVQVILQVMSLCLLYVSVGQGFVISSTSSRAELTENYEMTSLPPQPKDNTSVMENNNKRNPNISTSVSNSSIPTQVRTSQINNGDLHPDQKPLKILTTEVQNVQVQNIHKILLHLNLMYEIVQNILNASYIEKQNTRPGEDVLEFERNDVISSTISNETRIADDPQEDKERRVIRSTSHVHESILFPSVTPTSTSNFSSMESSGTLENLKPIQNSNLSSLRSDDISAQTVTEVHSTSENHLDLRTNRTEDLRSNPTAATNVTNSQTDNFGLCHLLTLATLSNFKNESETRIYGLKANSCHPRVLDQAYLNDSIQRLLESLIDIEYQADILRKNIVDKHKLDTDSALLNYVNDHGCVSKFPLDSEITAENGTQEIYESLVQIYALLDMTSKEFEDIANGVQSIQFKDVQKEIEKLQQQILKALCNADLLLRSKGVPMPDFPIYIKREGSSMFNSRLFFEMNLYANLNRIHDYLQEVKVAGTQTLSSLLIDF
ncbi:uncharacterized protein LOC134239203 [Saccostrea cucullata]|uniref:uncharacterized protein LOC134239203 n=1 Tax=Saccostrea cuccullata TaxID=36930 RepID=UPI002ED1B1EE